MVNVLLATYRLCRRNCCKDPCAILTKSMCVLEAAEPLVQWCKHLVPKPCGRWHSLPSDSLLTVASELDGLEELKLDICSV